MRFVKYAGFHDMLAERGTIGVAEYLTKTGIRAYEACQTVDGRTKPDLDTAEAICLAAEGRLNIECYTMFIDLWHGDREGILRDAIYNLELAKKLNARYCHHIIAPGDFWRRSDVPSYDELLETVFPYLLKIAKHALSLGIMPLFEPQGMYFNGIDGLEKLILRFDAELGEGKVNVLFDSGNSIFLGVKPIDFLKKFASRVKHVHIKDYRYASKDETIGIESCNDDRFIDVFPGEGALEVESCVKYLESHGYTGNYSCEVLVKGYNNEEIDFITRKWLNCVLSK